VHCTCTQFYVTYWVWHICSVKYARSIGPFKDWGVVYEMYLTVSTWSALATAVWCVSAPRTARAPVHPVINGKVVRSHPSRFEWSFLTNQPDICIHLNEVSIECQHDFNANALLTRFLIAVLFPLLLFLLCRGQNDGSLRCISCFSLHSALAIMFHSKVRQHFGCDRVLSL